MRERRIKQDVANQRVGTPLYMGSEDVRVERSEKITYFAYKKFGMLDFFRLFEPPYLQTPCTGGLTGSNMKKNQLFLNIYGLSTF